MDFAILNPMIVSGFAGVGKRLFILSLEVLKFLVKNGCEWLRRIVNDCIYLCDEIGLVGS